MGRRAGLSDPPSLRSFEARIEHAPLFVWYDHTRVGYQ